MAELSSNICLICSKSYKRPEHLRRHQLSHSEERPFQCELCSKTFQRTDVLKRHLTTCDPDTLPEPKPKRSAWPNPFNPSEPAVVSSGGRELPAPQLSAIGQDFFQDNIDGPPYEHMAGWIAGGASSLASGDPSDAAWQDFLTLNSEIQTPRSTADAVIDDFESLNFLDNFTSKTGLVCSFDCGTVGQRRQVAAEFAKSQLNSDLRTSNAKSLPIVTSITSFVDVTEFDVGETEPSRINIHDWLSDPLSLKSHEIINSIKDVVLKSNQSSVPLTWSSAMHELCLQFFSPQKLGKYLEFYWAIWHPNVNFIHKPTFNPLSSKSVLVAAMSLIGACVSPDYTDVEGAKRWFNCVEEMAFNDRDFCDDSLAPFSRGLPEVEWRREKLQALQAAYIVCLFQNWEGTDASKRRIRRYRYSNVVAVARDIGIHNARHPDYSQQGVCEFVWLKFVLREELIRVFLWIFLLDTAFVIFNNLPPRMVIREMELDVACPEACFQSTTSEGCFNELQNNALASKPGFSLAVQMLYQDWTDPDLSVVLADLGPLNLFAMTSALHSHIFHHQNTFSCQGTLEPIHKALANWKKAWHLYVTKFSPSPQHSPVADHNFSHTNMWKRVGFMRHASEYWLLANLIAQHLSAPAEDEIEMLASAMSKRPSSRTGDNSTSPLLDKVDETSMQQVNILISDFRKASIR